MFPGISWLSEGEKAMPSCRDKNIFIKNSALAAELFLGSAETIFF